MRFTMKFENDEWTITPSDGDFAGFKVATAEGITVEDATFFDDSITGEIKSVWGLTIIEDDLTASREMVRGLGIGQVFQSPASIPFLQDNGGFFCTETTRPLHHAAHVMLLNQGKFYGK